MSQRHYVQLAGGSTLEVTDRVDLEGWKLTEKAEEGAVGSGTMWLADPAMDFDVDGLRDYYVIEDESEATDNVLFGGFVVDPELSRGEQGGTHYDPVARMWQIQLIDRNGYWNRRVMTGTDCKRPAENDTARVAWLLASSEGSWVEDATTYVVSSGGTAMDKVDYRGQYLDQVMADMAEQSGRNWWVQLQETGTGREDVAWYGKDSLATYTSPLFLTNDPTALEEDATAGAGLVHPISDDTVLRRDLSRVYTGGYLTYGPSNRAIYRVNATSAAVYGRRDGIFSAPNVRTKAKAVARLTRLLADGAEPDERITTTVKLPKGKVTQLRAGMRVQFKATHLEGYTTWQWLRVLSCSVSPVSAGEEYKLTLELQGSGATAAAGPPYTGDAFFSILRGVAGVTDYGAYSHLGDAAPSGWDTEVTVGAMWSVIGDAGVRVGVMSDVPMRVRVHVKTHFSVVSDTSPRCYMKIAVLDQMADATFPGSGLEFWSGFLELDFEYDLAAGEPVLLTTEQSGRRAGGWDNVAIGETFLRVGRGGPYLVNGDPSWTGPT